MDERTPPRAFFEMRQMKDDELMKYLRNIFRLAAGKGLDEIVKPDSDIERAMRCLANGEKLAPETLITLANQIDNNFDKKKPLM